MSDKPPKTHLRVKITWLTQQEHTLSTWTFSMKFCKIIERFSRSYFNMQNNKIIVKNKLFSRLLRAAAALWSRMGLDFYVAKICLIRWLLINAAVMAESFLIPKNAESRGSFKFTINNHVFFALILMSILKTVILAVFKSYWK